MLGLENGNKSGMHGEHRIGPNPYGNPKYNVIFLFFLEDGGPQILYPKILTDILQVNIQKDMILK